VRSQPLEQDYDYQEAPLRRQEQRGGRQTGGTGVALGVLSNPPSSDGNYNFNFSNDDGSSRQEVGAPDAIRGSYSFVSPARVIKQRVPKFKNFPIVGLKKTVTEDAEATVAASLEEHPRDAREAVVKTVSEEPDLDNLFVEEAVYLTPADRDQRALEQLDQDHEESFDALFFDEDLENDDNERAGQCGVPRRRDWVPRYRVTRAPGPSHATTRPETPGPPGQG